MGSGARRDSEEFGAGMKTKRNGTATFDDIADALDRFHRLGKAPAISPSAAIDILFQMGFSLPLQERNVFLFPALIEYGKPESVWTKTESTSSEIQGMQPCDLPTVTVLYRCHLQAWYMLAFVSSASQIPGYFVQLSSRYYSAKQQIAQTT